MGYSGGQAEWPTYQSIGDHTECIQVTYDPAVLSYPQLLQAFWEQHNWRHNDTSYPQYMNGVCGARSHCRFAPPLIRCVQDPVR